MFEAFHQANLTLKPNKCILGASKLCFLGHIVYDDGLQPDPNKVKAIRMTKMTGARRP